MNKATRFQFVPLTLWCTTLLFALQPQPSLATLHDAAKWGNVEAAHDLIRGGADVNQQVSCPVPGWRGVVCRVVCLLATPGPTQGPQREYTGETAWQGCGVVCGALPIFPFPSIRTAHAQLVCCCIHQPHPTKPSIVQFRPLPAPVTCSCADCRMSAASARWVWLLGSTARTWCSCCWMRALTWRLVTARATPCCITLQVRACCCCMGMEACLCGVRAGQGC